MIASKSVVVPATDSVGNMRRISLKNCPYCGCSKIYLSASATLWQQMSVLFLLRLVRCHTCMRRHYRPIFLPAARNPARAPERRTAAAVLTIKEKAKHPA
jgi:hypothetical protein